ncbi:MAG: Ig-like domain-containing protein [Acidobacteriaceae bacterium]|jgi:uncharacterized protein YjdB|nr:Ig-like domain-containing protein [Acidobacteriaceae bacterium]
MPRTGFIYSCTIALTALLIMSCSSKNSPVTPDPAPGPSIVAVTGVTVAPPTLNLLQGSTGILTATVAPANASNQAVTWSSSNTVVATVDSGGKVTASGLGVADITATTADGGKTAHSTVTVTAPPPPPSTIAVTGVTLSPGGFTHGTLGTTIHLTATVLPTNATNQKVTWSIDRGGSTVTPTGLLTADLTFGSLDPFDLIITTDDGGFKASVGFTVDPVFVTGITLGVTSPRSMAVGNTLLVSTAFKVAPANATNPSLSFSYDDNIVRIGTDGVITAIAKGTTTITATTNDGGFKANLTVNVN